MKGFSSLMFLGFLGLSLGAGNALGSEVDQEDDAAGLGATVQMVYVGYPLRLACNFTDTNNDNGNGETTTAGAKNRIELDWYKDDELLKESDRLKIFQENSTMLINMPLRTDYGTYRCETQTGEETLSKTIRVIYLEIKKMDRSQNVVEKEAITIECPADGMPAPSIMWLKDQKPIAELYNDSSSRISVSDNTYKMVNGSLTITDAQWGDRGNYSCIVTSLIQSYEKWTYLRVKDVYAALWPFIGIVIEVVILGIIIIIFEKRRAKAEFDESDTDPGNDQKNTADRSKDMRRRK